MARSISIGKSDVPISLNVVNKLLTFMIVMVVAPISSFYAVQYAVVEYGGIAERDSTLWGAGASIFCVNVIMGLYVLVAFMEEDEGDDRSVQEKETQKSK
eukprot:m.68491 g.68491  ORF g.68491 m.68491 type:complete len:100 (+) comp15987_c0_seq3:210-509(+)